MKWLGCVGCFVVYCDGDKVAKLCLHFVIVMFLLLLVYGIGGGPSYRGDAAQIYVNELLV